LRAYYGISNPDDPRIGSGDGRSVTTSACFFPVGYLGLIADIGGWNDSDHRFTGQDMADLTIIELSSQGVEKLRFLIFESLASDTMQLKTTLGELVHGFGESALQSIVVVASKLDRADCDGLQKRLDYIKQTMQDMNIGDRLVTWQSKGLDEKLLPTQVQRLIDSILATSTVTTHQLEDLNLRIQERAKQLHANQVLQKRSMTMDVEENYVKQIEVLKDVEQEYWTIESTDMSLMELEMKTNPVPAVISYIATLGIRAITSAMTRTQKEEWVRQTRVVEKLEDAFVNDTRMVTRTVEVTLPLRPLRDFVSPARDEITSETKAKMMQISS